jgi:spermidine/putrescine transport system substrate-binding protein
VTPSRPPENGPVNPLRGVDPALLRGITGRRFSRRDLFRYAGIGAGALSLSALATACHIPGAAANAGSAGFDWTKVQQHDKLVIANWEDYIDVDDKGNSPTIDDFEKATGIQTTYKTDVNDNDPFLSRIIPSLSAGEGTGYDLIVITNGGPIEKMIRLGFLIPLDAAYLDNFYRYCSRSVLDPTYDPGNRFTTAWQSGLTGIAYNSNEVKQPPTSFKDLMDPDYKGRIGMFANNQDLPCAALVYLGIDVAKSGPSDWQKAADMLTEQRPLVRKYYDQSYINALEDGDIIITQAWSGDAFIAAASKKIGGDGFPEVGFALPDEGGILWTDNMAIPLKAENPVDALQFMNFVYQPKIAAQIADFVWYVSPVPDAKQVVVDDLKDPEVGNSPLVFPTEDALAKSQKYKVFASVEEEAAWNKIFQPIYGS